MIEFKLVVFMCSHCTQVFNEALHCQQHECQSHVKDGVAEMCDVRDDGCEMAADDVMSYLDEDEPIDDDAERVGIVSPSLKQEPADVVEERFETNNVSAVVNRETDLPGIDQNPNTDQVISPCDHQQEVNTIADTDSLQPTTGVAEGTGTYSRVTIGKVEVITLDDRDDMMDTPHNNTSTKPTYSYIALISMAILNAPPWRLTERQICDFIMTHFPYYKSTSPAWQNSIRFNLAANDCFIKVAIEWGSPDKGSWWMLHPVSADMFDNGSFLRRRRIAKRAAPKLDGKSKLMPNGRIPQQSVAPVCNKTRTTPQTNSRSGSSKTAPKTMPRTATARDSPPRFSPTPQQMMATDGNPGEMMHMMIQHRQRLMTMGTPSAATSANDKVFRAEKRFR